MTTTAAISVLICVTLAYTVALFTVSYRRDRRGPDAVAPPGLFFVIVQPCLNEAVVIRRSLERLLTMNGDFAVLVVDDGSDDETSEVVRAVADDRVHLIRRELPDARRGKGAVLNHAYRHLVESDLLAGRRPEDVVMGIVDADGRIDVGALGEVAPFFADPHVGGVQIGVRMVNRRRSLLARMQDFEFVTYNEIFQRGRETFGSVGLGGNGQFTRLSALGTLGDRPWSDALAEDLDLGLRLLIGGWTLHYCSTADVAQQALTSVRPLFRQRTRWFQGHLQTWRRIPQVLRSGLPTRTLLDLIHVVLQPGLVLALSLLPVALVTLFAVVLIDEPGNLGRTSAALWGVSLTTFALLTFGLTPFLALAYRRHETSVSALRALGYAFLYVFYGYMWSLVGWRATARIVMRRSSWAKTERLPEAVADPVAAGGAG